MKNAYSFLGLALSLASVACGSSPPPAPITDTPPTPPAGAAEGASCGDGVLGAPNVPCASGLVCDTSAGTAPNAPPGASGSARGGVCKKGS